MKLLIVDDQSTVVQGLLHCTNWAAMGFTVVDTALNAVDAKASLLRQEAEVMLCDIEMPMESGLDLLDWLRQRGMTTRCIFLTAHAEFKYAQEALRLGGFDYIMQPAPYEQVADAVSRALDNVKEEWAALELQSRGAVFDDQKKEIVETMLRGFLLGNAPGSSLTAFEELSLVPRRERECWVALMQPLPASLAASVTGWPWHPMLRRRLSLAVQARQSSQSALTFSGRTRFPVRISSRIASSNVFWLNLVSIRTKSGVI